MRKVLAAAGGFAVVAALMAGPPADAQPAPPAGPDAPQAEIAGVAAHFGISTDEARTQLQQQGAAHRLAASLPRSLTDQLAGEWFDAESGSLTVAVTSDAAARQASAAGARPVMVHRGKEQLDDLNGAVRKLVGAGVPGVFGWGTDVRANDVTVSVDQTRATSATDAFVAKASALGVRVVRTQSQPHQQAGTVNTGNPWWPGSESNCSVGFPATDAGGAKQFLTAGHCTNDVNQVVYGASGQQNRLGTSNVGGTHSVNGHEGDMGVVAVTESGWTLSSSVNTWGQPAVTVTGAADALVGDRVCHSGNTSHWQCGEVRYTHKSVDYGGGVVIDDLTWTTACSLGGDSGGGWLLGDKATGLHDGGPSQCVDNPSDGDMSLYQPVTEALTRWNLTLVTGGGGGSDTTAPAAPGNPRVTGSTAGSVSLAWDAATDNVGVTGYEIYSGSTVAATATGTSATVSGLAADTAYTFTVKALDAAGNRSPASVSVSARTAPGGGGGRTFGNDADFAIRDYQQVSSPVTVSLSGRAATAVSVAATIQHTCVEDLGISLLDPSGRAYVLKYSGGSTCTVWSGARTFTANNVSAQARGTWRLRITDYGAGDTGTLDTWSLTV